MAQHRPGSSWAARVIVLLLALITLLLAWSIARRSTFPKAPASGVAGRELTAPTFRPNVVIFLIDTLRADRLGVYGYDKATSPHIDALARDSVLFEQAYAPAPWTLPSVVSLFTSTFPCAHGVLADGQRAPSRLVTLAQRLKSAGYVTASFHANPYAGSMSGMDAGFDQAELVPAVDGAMVDQWLEERGAEPFFLYIHNVEPHDPYVVPQRFIETFGAVTPERCRDIGRRLLDYRALTRVDFAAGRPPGTTDNTRQQIEAIDRIAERQAEIGVLYDAAVRHADDRVGQVIGVLKQRGYWDGTLFLLLSDHGEELGDHGGWQHDQSVYEELVHVPLLIHTPHNRGETLRVSSPVNLVDVTPTILDVLGFTDHCHGCSGRSLRSTWTALNASEPATISIPSMRWNVKKFFRPYKQSRGDINIVMRVGDWKGIFNAEPRTLELYDLGHDARELTDLASTHKPLVDELRLEAREWLSACAERAKGAEAPASGTLDEAQLERLRSLGYVE